MPLTITPVVPPSGNGLVFLAGAAPFTRAGGLPSPSFVAAVSSSLAMPTVRINGGSPVSLGTSADSYWISTVRDIFGALVPTCPYIAFYPAGFPTISPSDVVTVSYPDGWATFQGGSAVAANNVPAVNLAGSAFYPDLPASPTMKVGLNFTLQPPYNLNIHYTNLFMGAAEFGGDGSITSHNSGSFFQRINQSPSVYGDGKTAANAPVGDWVFAWDGASNATLFPFGGAVDETGTATLTGAANNVRHYTFGGDADHHGPDVFCTVGAAPGATPDGSGNYAYDFHNPRLVPAGTDIDNVPLFRPNILTRLNAGTAPQSIRFLDPLGGNAGNAATYADYQCASLSRAGVVRTINANIARIERYTGTDPLMDPSQGLQLLITTTAPHGLAKGQSASIYGYSGNPGLAISDGTSENMDGHQIICYPLTSTTLAAFDFSVSGAGRHVSGVVTPTAPQAYITMTVANGIPLSDMVAACNAANCDFYFNTSISSTDDALSQCAAYIAAHLNPGLKLRVEPFNEVWNGIQPTLYLSQQSYQLVGTAGGFPYPAYVTIGQSHHNIMKSAWDAGGRDPADFIRVFGTQQGSTQVTAYLIQELLGLAGPASRDIDFEELVFGSYMFNYPFVGPSPETGKAPLINRMSVPQHIDVLELNYTFGGHEVLAQLHLDTLTGKQSNGTHLYQKYINVRPGVYEGGPDFLAVQGGTTVDYQALGRATVLHPRTGGVVQHLFRIRNDSGCTTFNVFNSGDVDRPYSQWSAYRHTAELPYAPGDPAQDAIQTGTPDRDRVDLARSVTGWAVNAWQSRVSGTAPAPDYTLAAMTPVTVTAGGASATTSVHLNAGNGYTGTAALTITGLPSGVTGVFAPTSLTGGGTVNSTLTLTATGGATVGTVTATVTAADAANGLTHGGSLAVTVAPGNSGGGGGGPVAAAVALNRVKVFARLRTM
jgi:hypothetical protein